MGYKTIKAGNVKYAILGLFVISILLLGVEGCPKEEVISEGGLLMSFVEEAPPSNIISGQSVPIYVDIKNTGGVHIGTSKATFYLGGIGPNLDGVTQKLLNKRFLDKGTGSERLVFAKNAKSSLELGMPHMFGLTLTSCYNYETMVQIEACIATNKSSVCSIAGEKVTSSSNSVAPIQVTSFTEEVIGNKLIITFIVENKGITKNKAGKTYLKNAKCDLIHERDINEILKGDLVNVEIIVGKGDNTFKCDLQDGILPLSPAGKGKVTCRKIISDEDYSTVFKIILKYKYVDSIASAVTILPS